MEKNKICPHREKESTESEIVVEHQFLGDHVN